MSIPFLVMFELIISLFLSNRQARGCKRDWNNPAKADRTSTKVKIHSTATKRASGSPVGAIKA
jgi:hypothetical protein